MKLLVTRPLEDSGALAAKLESLGHEPVIVPLLAITARDAVVIPDMPFQALCVSSANGLLAKADLAAFKHLPFFAIGPQSALEARRHGFDHVHDKGGNVEGLVRTIVKQAKPGNGPILYLSGSETTGDLEGKLKANGFAVSRLIVYDAKPCTVEGLDGFCDGADGVLLYSPRSAKLWTQQVALAHLDGQVSGLQHFCLSANVAATLPQNWRKTISAAPDENAMLQLLDLPDQALD